MDCVSARSPTRCMLRFMVSVLFSEVYVRNFAQRIINIQLFKDLCKIAVAIVHSSVHLSVHSALSLKFFVKQVYSLTNALSLWNNTKWPYISLNILLLKIFSQYVCPSIRLSADRCIRVPLTHFLVFDMLWGIELKLCVCLCYDESQVKFKFHVISSNFKWVMPLFWLGILHI